MEQNKGLSCDLINAKVRPVATILQPSDFDVHQDQEVFIEGFVIIAAKRHITSITEFSDEEAADFINLLRRVRSAMQSELNITEVVLVQKEMPTKHWHLWVFPRYTWMNDVQPYGTTLSSITAVMKHAKENMNTEEYKAKAIEAAEKISMRMRSQ